MHEKIIISIGKSRSDKHWSNKRISWEDLTKKLSKTHRTAETVKEYAAAPPDRQAEIKDIGGFVGGTIRGGRRKKKAILGRQLVTLDLDFAPRGFWDTFTLFYGCAACLYSTHKHTAETPRLRLIIPLDREVTPEEYEPICRRIAADIGIDYVDHTSYQPSRLMYWPSTSSNGVYEFQQQPGEWLCADDILARYKDWRDISEWPAGLNEEHIIRTGADKQGNPLEKEGVIGVFCRLYDIHEAIETFLPAVYEATDTDDRYTYKKGTTSGGAIVYDDLWLYSYHSTDPACEKLCNAFDLVRIHLFGQEDDDPDPKTPVTRLPSYKSMMDLCLKDSRVILTLAENRVRRATEDFQNHFIEEPAEDAAATPDETDDEFDADPEDEPRWLATMEMDKNGNFRPTVDNLVKILENDTRLKGCFALDTFEHREITLRHLPWREIGNKEAGDHYLTDRDDASLRHYIESVYGISARDKLTDAMGVLMLRRSVHPVREYLEGLQWDGVPRVEQLLGDYMGAELDDYVKTATRKTMAAAVARIFKPGVKYDHVLTLIGPEGIGKSTLFDKLGGRWFSDSFSTVMGKEASEQTQGVWLVEMGELSGLKKADVESIKLFISKRFDRYRAAYGRRVENYPRQCIFVATTNEVAFLRGATGNRRFWPVVVNVTEVRKDPGSITPADAGQIWAEAVQIYRKGEKLYFSKDMEKEARRRQENHTETDERTGMIMEYLETEVPENWYDLSLYERRQWLQSDDELKPPGTMLRDRVCVAEIWCELLGGTLRDLTRFNTSEIHNILAKIKKWERVADKIRIKGYGLQRGYSRITQVKSTTATRKTRA